MSNSPFATFPTGPAALEAVPVGISSFPVYGRSWFLNANNGNDGNYGNTPDAPFKTMARVMRFVQSLDNIYVVGQIKEEIVAPLGVSGVGIIGAATRTRYGNEGSFANPLLDYAAAWRPPASPTAATPLLILRQQGWWVANMLFDCPVDAAGIKLWRAEDAVHPDPSSFMALNCQFGDGQDGIEDVGGCYNILVDGNRFRALTGIAYKVTSTGIAVPLRNQIQNNIFIANANDIVGSFADSVIQNNLHIHTTTQKINTIALAAQGSHNFVINNYTDDVAADIDPAHGYTGSATDVWRTFAKDQAAAVITSPPV